MRSNHPIARKQNWDILLQLFPYSRLAQGPTVLRVHAVSQHEVSASRGEPPFGSDELDQLTGIADRMVVDSREWERVPRALARLVPVTERLAVSDVRQVSAESWPRELKCRSRMHYYLAERDVRKRVPGARPLLLDERGNVNETPTANIVGYRGPQAPGQSHGGLVTPQEFAALPGISLAALKELALSPLGGAIGCLGADFSPAEFIAFVDELWITSTPFSMLPVVQLDDALIGDGRPGPMFRKLLDAWSASVGVDIPAQARQFARRTDLQA